MLLKRQTPPLTAHASLSEVSKFWQLTFNSGFKKKFITWKNFFGRQNLLFVIQRISRQKQRKEKKVNLKF